MGAYDEAPADAGVLWLTSARAERTSALPRSTCRRRLTFACAARRCTTPARSASTSAHLRSRGEGAFLSHMTWATARFGPG